MTPLLTSQGDAGKLEELIERVSRATGPDREIDLALINTFAPHQSGRPYRWGAQVLRPGDRTLAVLDIENEDEVEYWLQTDLDTFLFAAPKYTASIDAALALVERALPGWGCQVGRPIQTYTSGWYASVFRERLPGEHDIFAGSFSDFAEDRGGRPRDSYRQNGAIAIILATLRALKTLSGERHG